MARLEKVLKDLELEPCLDVTFHPVTDFFPLVHAEFIRTLGKDIAENGLRDPIVRCGGAILDGRARYLACRHLGVTPAFADVDLDDDEAFKLLVSKNVCRADLNCSQRAMVAAKMAGFEHGGDRRCVQGVILRFEKITQDEAARRLDVSPSYVGMAKKVLKHNDADLIELVSDGWIPVNIAAAAVKHVPRAELDEVLQDWQPHKRIRGAIVAAKKRARSLCDTVKITFEVPDQVAKEFALMGADMQPSCFFAHVYLHYKRETADGQLRMQQLCDLHQLPLAYRDADAFERAGLAHEISGQKNCSMPVPQDCT